MFSTRTIQAVGAAFVFLCVAAGDAGKAYSQSLPNGTIIQSRLRGPLGNAISRIAGTYWTHTAIVIDGKACEATWPRSKCTPVARYVAKPHWQNSYQVPQRPLSASETQGVRSYVYSHLDQRYGLRHFWNPSARPNGIYCSEFVTGALRSSGISMPRGSQYTPDTMIRAARNSGRY